MPTSLALHRGSASTMADEKSTLVLAAGELFVEYPDLGINSGHCRFKIGDGVTQYANLPYTDIPISTETVSYTANSGTNFDTVIGGAASGGNLGNIIAALKQAISIVKNQADTHYAFSGVTDGTTTITADQVDDVLTISAGNNISITYDATNDTITIAGAYSDATQSASGLMSASDKTKLDGLSNGVSGVKGDGETDYRTGNVNITKANIGLGNVDNTADANKSVSSAATLTTARNISITGAATAAAVAFDGSAAVALNVTALDASYVDGSFDCGEEIAE